MKKLLVLFVPFILFACDSPFPGVKQDVPAERSWGNFHFIYFRIYPTDSKLRKFRIEEFVKVNIDKSWEEHDDTYWHLAGYSHEFAEGYWNAFRDYGLRVLGDKGAHVEYVFDKHPWYEYDHYHWYLVVDGVRIAEYEKVGGLASAAYDHVRLLRSWWDYQYRGEWSL